MVRQKVGDLQKENHHLSEEIIKIGQEKSFIENELGKVRQNMENNVRMGNDNCERRLPNSIPNHPGGAIPKRINGWGVQLRGNYYRLFKKINGKVKWIHIGRDWNIETARKKIENFHGETMEFTVDKVNQTA